MSLFCDNLELVSSFFEGVKLTDLLSALGTVGSFVVAFVTYKLFQKSDQERRPDLSGEIVISNHYMSGLTVFAHTEIKLWNAGLVGSSVKKIELRPHKNDFAHFGIEMERGFEDNMRLDPGQIITRQIKFIVGGAIQGTTTTIYGAPDDPNALEKAFAHGSAQKIDNFDVIIHFTNHRPLQIFQVSKS